MKYKISRILTTNQTITLKGLQKVANISLKARRIWFQSKQFLSIFHEKSGLYIKRINRKTLGFIFIYAALCYIHFSTIVFLSRYNDVLVDLKVSSLLVV